MSALIVKKSDSVKTHCRKSVWTLAFSWVFGVSLGLLYASHMHEDFSSMMRTAISSRVSIVGLLIILLLPYVSSVGAVFFHPALVYLFAAGKGMCFSFCVYLIMVQFPSTGWLLCRLLLFSEFSVMVPMLLLWIRLLEDGQQSLKHDSLLYLIVALTIGILDYCIISPFTVNLMLHS